MSRRHDDALFDEPRRQAPPGGPVYQGVAAQFRELFPKDDEAAQQRKRELAGWLKLALSHARAIDNEPRPTVGRAQTSSELRETLAAVAEALSAGDAFNDFLEELRHGSDPAAPHPEV